MTTASPNPAPLILTVGHSTRPLGDFLALLRAHSVTRLVDVRTIPRSLRNPQFNHDTLPASLGPIAYVHAPALGGLRHAKRDSINTAWENASFRGFADYMQTDEFRLALDALVSWAVSDRLALMCAESLPWRCHRSLIADALVARGFPVSHIFSLTSCKPHRLTSFAVVRDARVLYPAGLLDHLNERSSQS